MDSVGDDDEEESELDCWSGVAISKAVVDTEDDENNVVVGKEKRDGVEVVAMCDVRNVGGDIVCRDG